MKKFLAIVILSLSLTTPSQSDDIRDFEIEGFSVGDSLLDYFSKKEIDEYKSMPSWPNKKYTRFVSFENLNIYDGILFYFKDDGNYLVSSISAILKFPNNINSCYKKKMEVTKDFKDIFTDYKTNSYKSDHQQDKTGKSKNDIIDFNFSNGASSRVICTDWSKEKGIDDELRVILSSKEYTYFITNEAYK